MNRGTKNHQKEWMVSLFGYRRWCRILVFWLYCVAICTRFCEGLWTALAPISIKTLRKVIEKRPHASRNKRPSIGMDGFLVWLQEMVENPSFLAMLGCNLYQILIGSTVCPSNNINKNITAGKTSDAPKATLPVLLKPSMLIAFGRQGYQ